MYHPSALSVVAHECVRMCRPAADASGSAPGIAAETILEDEPEEDVAPTPEQLEVALLLHLFHRMLVT